MSIVHVYPSDLNIFDNFRVDVLDGFQGYGVEGLLINYCRLEFMVFLFCDDCLYWINE